MGELDATEVRDLLQGQHVGRLTCQETERSSIVSVRYTSGDPDHVRVRTVDQTCAALAQAKGAVRFEVDEVDGPARWSTVIGWGFFEKPADDEHGAYLIRFTDVRGFYRGARPSR